MIDQWFDDTPVIGAMPPDEARAKLAEVGEQVPDDSNAGTETFSGGLRGLFGREPRAWQHTAHTFGYVGPVTAGATDPVGVTHAGAMAADESLRNARIRVTLDRLRIADYPGGGMHRLLFDFYAQNQAAARMEHLHFNASFRAHEGESVAAVGYPIFSGLNVGPEGLAFKCFTVNVKNDDDENLLGFLDGDVFKTGLHLATTAQPALAPLSAMALGLTKAIAKRHRNVAVQDFYLGLDFSDIPFRARLATGSYIAVQIPETLTSVWRWSDWVYVPATGQLASREDPSKLIEQNYVVFGISRSTDAARRVRS